ncbi:MAG: diaminopimelate decarboxylase [Candidatus Liptonbacteria bacterium]|nr:diaminopimelate decarboxylase [Candidatus Liptonbacteria bacterium]
MTIRHNKLYLGGISAETLVRKFGSPLYVYEENALRAQYRKLARSITYPYTRIFYACKANTNPEIMKLFGHLGARATPKASARRAGIEAVSVGEVKIARRAGFPVKDIIFTCDNLTPEEIKYLIRHKIAVSADSLGQLEKFGRLNPGGKISLRVNQGIGAGMHSHIITGGRDSKFGIYKTQLDEARRLAARYRLRITGLMQHIGSGVLDEKIYLRAMHALLTVAHKFPDLEFINLGGGIGIPYRPEHKPLDLKSTGAKISEEFRGFIKAYGRELKLYLEPGRFLVAESGILLATVAEIKKTPAHTFVGLNTGMQHLIRPAIYGAYHEIVNASRMRGPKKKVEVVGNICESSDFLARGREITLPREGEILATLNAGAYGYSMSSNYNSHPRPAEVMARAGRARIIRKRERI